MKRKALIVGAGIGGLTTAVRLLSKGYEVQIFEKESSVGGRINYIKTNGYHFDLTASVLMLPNDFKEIFTWAGQDYRDYLQFVKLDPYYRVNYADGSRHDFSTDFPEFISLLESFSKKDSLGYLKFLGDAYGKYLLANKNFLNQSFTDTGDFFNPATLIEALKIKAFSTTYNYISKYIKNEKLKQFVCFQALYIGISPYQSSNVYTLLPTVSQLYGLWYLKGGMYSFVKALQKLISRLGGTIETGTRVEEILIKDNKAIGLKTDKGVAKGAVVVCNADFPYAMQKLVKTKQAKGAYTAKKLKKMKYSCSAFIMYLGLNKKYEDLLVHNLYFNDDFKRNIEAPFRGKLPEKPSLYIYCPSRIDAGMAPPGKESLNVTVRVPNLYFKNIKWDRKTIYSLRKNVIKTLRRIKGLADIEENIVYESCLTPVDLLLNFNSHYGTAFGLSHTLTQTNYFRPQVKAENIDNLYFTGSSIHPGNGISMVLISSKLAVKKIISDQK